MYRVSVSCHNLDSHIVAFPDVQKSITSVRCECIHKQIEVMEFDLYLYCVSSICQSYVLHYLDLLR